MRVDSCGTCRKPGPALATVRYVESPPPPPPRSRPEEGSAPVGIWSWHVPTDQVTLSGETYRIYGLDPQSFGGAFSDCLAIIHPDDRAHVQTVSMQALQEKRGVPIEFRVVRPDGTQRLVRAEADVFLDAHGEVERMAGMVQDITTARAMEIRQRRLVAAVEQVAEAILITDPTGVIQYVNDAFEKTTGYGREHAVGRRPDFLRHPSCREEDVAEMLTTLGGGDAWAGRLRGQRSDGTSFLFDATISPVEDDEGALINFVAVQRDVTREAALTEQLQHFQKMEAVGMLAGGIAHDFNNLLIAIIGHSDLLLLKTEGDADLQRHAGAIRKAGERARTLTSQLLAFGRKQVLQPLHLDLNEVLREQEGLLRRVIEDDIELEILRMEGRPIIHADPGQIEQVLLNLVTNAQEAMPGGGTITLRVAVESLGQEACELLGAAEPGRHVVLRVEDTGLGMDADTRERIFEPFFTTKGMRLGTGLGLATVYGIVRQSGGGIRVSSTPGQGSTFEVCFPLDEGSVQPTTEGPARSTGFAGSATILVAEDEPLVASIVKSTLRANGFTVLFGEDGERALEVAAAHDGPIDLLFTDVVMPRMDGVALAAELGKQRPGTPVLFSSGYTNSALMQRGALIEGVDLLQKPYTPTVLIERVREKLDSDARTQSLTGS